jgi:hypothetical protein
MSFFTSCIGLLIFAPSCHAFVSISSNFQRDPPAAIQTSLHLSGPNNSQQRGLLGKLGDVFEEAAASTADYLLMQPKREVPSGLRRVRTQFIAALGDPKASSGRSGAEEWGIWRVDPGPRGVFLNQFENSVAKRGGTAPAGWQWDPNDFWIEEYGRVMEKPSFPVPAGKYLVTGGRQTTTVLTVMPPDASGRQGWSLEKGALFDVTHLPCRSARYTPSKGQVASPSDANELDFPVKPGAAMPPIPGCQKQDYAVLFVLAVDRDSSW